MDTSKLKPELTRWEWNHARPIAIKELVPGDIVQWLSAGYWYHGRILEKTSKGDGWVDIVVFNLDSNVRPSTLKITRKETDPLNLVRSAPKKRLTSSQK